MKLIKKFLGIAAIFAVIGFMALPLTGCPEAGDGDNNNNKTTPTPETPTTVYYTGDNIEEFAAWLAKQPEGVLCDVKLTLDDLGSIVSVLNRYPNKKISLDLSDNTFTSIGNSTFSQCSSLTSVTLTGSNITINGEAFPEGSNGVGGDSLFRAYYSGKAGTYTRAANGDTWSKQQ